MATKNLDPAALRAARKARVAARKATAQEVKVDEEDKSEGQEEEDKPSDGPTEVESAFNYNPLYSKQTNLGPNKPAGGYHYYGPPPDAGTSYGLYTTKAGIGIIAPKADGTEIKDPSTGISAKLEGPADKDVMAAVLAAASDMTTLPPCPSCKSVSVTSASVYSKAVASFHCTSCGVDMTKQVAAAKTTVAPTEAVQYEALSSYSKLGDIVEADVHMTLFDHDGANPFWNVDIKGMPVARVHLKDQAKPEETRAVFCSEQYPQGVAGAIAKLGPKTVFDQIQAKLWVNILDQSEKVKNIRDQVKAEVEAKHTETVAGWAENLLGCVALVCAGMDKNFFREDGNKLKEALYASFRTAGVPQHQILAGIEDGFATGSTPYFEAVLNRAIAYMNMPSEARAEIAKAIGASNVIMPQVSAEQGTDLPVVDPAGTNVGDPTNELTLASRLSSSSLAVSSVAGLPGANIGSKDALRATIRLGGAGPRSK